MFQVRPERAEPVGRGHALCPPRGDRHHEEPTLSGTLQSQELRRSHSQPVRGFRALSGATQSRRLGSHRHRPPRLQVRSFHRCNGSGWFLIQSFGRVVIYRVSHLLMDLGWVDFDLGVPPSLPAAQPLLPNSHQTRQNWADRGTLKFQVNTTQSTSRWDTLCKSLVP